MAVSHWGGPIDVTFLQIQMKKQLIYTLDGLRVGTFSVFFFGQLFFNLRLIKSQMGKMANTLFRNSVRDISSFVSDLGFLSSIIFSVDGSKVASTIS